MAVQRILCFDMGEKRIGLAVSDELGLTAQGVGVLTRSSLSGDLKKIKDLVQRFQAAKIVLGLPKNMDGSLGNKAQEVLAFKAYLEKHLLIPIETWDERLTTREAQRTLLEADLSRAKRKNVIDMLAATLILENYLQYHCTGENNCMEKNQGCKLEYKPRKDGSS